MYDVHSKLILIICVLQTCCKSCMTLYIFTTVKYYIPSESPKSSRFPQKRVAQAVKIVLKTPSALQQILARRKSVMDAVKTLWEGHVDAVGTL